MNRALPIIAGCILAATMPASAQFSTTVKHRYTTDCSDLKLKTAGGVPNESRHKYTLKGTCRYIHLKWVDGEQKPPEEVNRAFLTLGAVWDEKDSTLKEQGKLEGGASGKLSSIFKCSADPYLHNVSCTMIAHSNGTPWKALSDKPMKGRPIGQGHVNAAQAAQLSKQTASAAPPPPPPATKPPILKSPLSGEGALADRAGKIKSPVIKRPPVLKSPKPGNAQAVKKPSLNGGLLKGSMKFGVDLLGGDYKGFPLARPQPELCRNACSREVRCRSWTYVKPGIKGPQAACFLKNTVPPPTRNPCCVSGVK